MSLTQFFISFFSDIIFQFPLVGNLIHLFSQKQYSQPAHLNISEIVAVRNPVEDEISS